MKRSIVLTLVSAALLSGIVAIAKTGTTAPAQSEALVPLDNSTDCVLRFYRMMLQRDEPTAESEAEIFSDTEPWITKLRDKKALPDGKTTLMSWFRANKALFLPGHMQRNNELYLSSSFKFIASLDGQRKTINKNFSCVVCFFVNDRTLPYAQQKIRTVVFQLTDGKIDPDAIRLDGFESPYIHI